MLNKVRVNRTTIHLTDENTEPADEFGLGFIKARCGYCNANLHLSDSGVVTCLNACYLPAGAYRRLQRGLMEAASRVDHPEDDR